MMIRIALCRTLDVRFLSQILTFILEDHLVTFLYLSSSSYTRLSLGRIWCLLAGRATLRHLRCLMR